MSKRLLAFILVLCMVVLLTACTEDTPVAETDNPQVHQSHESGSDIPDWFDLPDINIEPGVAEGITKAKTETTSYLFRGRTEERNINLAQINEIAVSVLQNEYGYSPPKGRIINFIEEKGIRVNEFSLDEVHQMVATNGRTIINPDSINSVGALFYGSSRNLLPAWLAAGLELYWSDKCGIERIAFDKDFDVNAWQAESMAHTLPAFGDFWFKYSGDNEKLSVAFSFVKWLDENELLNEILRAYFDDKQYEGDVLFVDAWLKFMGQDIREDFFFENCLRYLYGAYLQTYNMDLQTNDFEYYTFSVSTEQSNYLFDRWIPWEKNESSDMIEVINSIDTQYIYAKQWLGFEDSVPIPTRILFDRSGGAAITFNTEYIAIPGSNPLVSVHEAVHHLLFTKNIQADFAWLSEGLPEAIQFIYADEDNNFYGPEMLTVFAKGNVNTFINEVSSLYHSLTGKEYDFNDTFDFKYFEHIKALDAVNYFIENDKYGIHANQNRAEDKPSAFPQGFLNTYDTSASFVIYLLDIGSKEDFMRLYTDISIAEELYGKDFKALYEQWLEFLTQL